MKKILLLSIFTLLSSFNFYAINQDKEDEGKKDNLQLSSFKFMEKTTLLNFMQLNVE